jgi:hypothetical protein
LLELDPASEAELTEIDDEALALAVRRVCADPSGQREPRHNYARRFRNASKHVNVGDRDVWEFKTSKWRGLFVIAKGSDRQGISFVPVKRRRFMTLGECPWHKGK